MYLRLALACFLVASVGLCSLHAQSPKRPHIVGLSHIALYAHDFEKSRAYYGCKRKVEMSGFCKVELSKLPFRELLEAEIGTFDDEWKRVAAG
jgi:hypothetical protein